MSLYSILNRDAKSWWYHAELRRKGNVEEARQRERRSIRERVRVLRRARDNGGHCSVGRGGWRINYDKLCTMSGHGSIESPMVQAAIALGLLTVDTTTIPDRNILGLHLPVLEIGCIDNPPCGVSYAPAEYLVSRWKELGATIYNWEED